MVEEQLVARDITDQHVLQAMRKVPRHLFIPEKRQAYAYEDGPLPIGEGQTISQPYVVASMTQHLELPPHARVLEVGSGCGYQAAILAELADEVYTIELVASLLDRARRNLKALGYHKVHTRVGDGALGWPEAAPFDGIMVTAAAPRIPPALVAQLKVGGRLLIPLANDPWGRQFLTKVVKTASGCDSEELYEVRFVPMVGEIEK